jgi:hypothetical protein
MTTKRKFNLIWLLLPFLLVRGLVPAGFMIDASSGSLSIVMCGGEGPLNVTALAEHSGHAMHHAHHGNDHEKHKGSICPFAIAGSSATFASIPSLPVDIEPVRTRAADVTAFHGLYGPSRTQQSRAPPFLS